MNDEKIDEIVETFFDSLVDADVTEGNVIVILAALIGIIVENANEEDRPVLMSVVNTIMENFQKEKMSDE